MGEVANWLTEQKFKLMNSFPIPAKLVFFSL